jgi:guanylate kinase
MSNNTVLEKMKEFLKEKKENGLVIVFTGPSASGKTEIVKRLVTHPKYSKWYQKALTATTRNPRQGERNGIDYWFLTPDEFNRQKEKGNIIEETKYAGARYGSLNSEIQRIWQLEKTPLLIMDMNGIEALKRYYGEKNVASIFVYRDLKGILEELKKRPIEEKEVKRRFELAKRELLNIAKCDWVVYNISDIDDAVEQAAEAAANASINWDCLRHV